MMRFRSFFLAAWLAAAAGSGGEAHAHGVWIAQRTGEWTVVLGEGPVDDEYKPESVKNVLGRRKDGSPVPVRLRPQARNAVLEAPPDVAAMAVTFEDGYWSQGADGKWVAGPRSQHPGAKRAGHYQMFSHAVLAAGAVTSKGFGLALEIVPLGDPMVLKKGRMLRVQVLFQGRPLAGAAVASDYVNDSAEHALKTDSKGQATVRLRSGGLNVIKVSHTVPRTDRSEADEDGYAGTLAFALPQPAED